MKTEFQKLMTELCALKNMGEPDLFIHGAPFSVNGVEVSLIYNELIDKETMFMYTAFGAAPMDNEAQIYKTLLKQNHIGFCGKGPGFCISPTTGKVGYVLNLRVAEMNADRLASMMTYFADKANEWRSTYFLDQQTPGTRRPHFVPQS
jgi:hypothetical protein